MKFCLNCGHTVSKEDLGARLRLGTQIEAKTIGYICKWCSNLSFQEMKRLINVRDKEAIQIDKF